MKPILVWIMAALLVVGLLLGVIGCSQNPANDRFVELASGYLDRMLELNPEWATNLGDHRFDHFVSDLTMAGVAERESFNREYLDQLDGINPRHLNTVNRIDYAILVEHCEQVLFKIMEIREHQWNPTLYNPGDGIYNLLAREFAPLKERLAAVKSRLEQLPTYLAAAKANLNNPPEIMTTTAMTQNQGVINLIMDGLQPYLDETPDMKLELAGARSAAIAALVEYGQWLEEDLLPRSRGDSRLGKRLWRLKLAFELSSDLEPEEIQRRAEADLETTREQMYEIALPLYHKWVEKKSRQMDPSQDTVIRLVLDRLAEDRPTNETIVAQAGQDLQDLRKFVSRNKLVSLPDDPIELIVMPEHQRGFYIAYCDSPGPLEKNGKTLYAISPTPADWTPERAETFYREYNDYMLQNLTVHEAMPGHYLQLAHANKFEAPTHLRAILSSGTFVEGWATYAEQLMVEAGFGGPELQLQQLKMRLRLIINAIIDQKIHTQGMTHDEAVELMMVEGFQEEAEAEGKWNRANLTSCQLSTYYVGNLEINAIRRDYEAQKGGRFKLKDFHDELLNYGSPPPRYVRELLGL